MLVRVVDDIAAASSDGRLHEDLVPGKTYEVIAVFSSEYVLPGESNDPVLYPPEVLEVLDPSIPHGWAYTITMYTDAEDPSEYGYGIGPHEFLVDGFWERLHDGDQSAIRTYHEVRKRYSRS